jgi:dihydroxy-acid dehydratase
MGRASANLPAISMPAGRCCAATGEVSFSAPAATSWKVLGGTAAGTLDECSWREMEDGIARSFGTCMTMGTASTMAAAMERWA